MTAKEFTRDGAYLSEYARRTTEAYERGARNFDQIKEIVLVDMGLVNTAEFLHRIAHWFPGEFDTLGDILHQKLIRQDYGATPAFSQPVEDLNDAFLWCMRTLREIEEALSEMIRACDDNRDWPLARQLETLQISVSEKKEQILYAWNMYEGAESPTSYDSWILHLMNGETGPAWAEKEDD